MCLSWLFVWFLVATFERENNLLFRFVTTAYSLFQKLHPSTLDHNMSTGHRTRIKKKKKMFSLWFDELDWPLPVVPCCYGIFGFTYCLSMWWAKFLSLHLSSIDDQVYECVYALKVPILVTLKKLKKPPDLVLSFIISSLPPLLCLLGIESLWFFILMILSVLKI